MKRSHSALVLTAALTAALASPGAAYAYLDPTSGSLILQLLLGGVAGLLVVLKLFWHRILALFGVERSEHEGSSEDAG